jgi:tetratricopeptide (TPR) repeat protein
VRREGGLVRITASLVDARTGEQVTSWAFERAESDVLQIQSEAASAIAGALRARLTAPLDRPARSADPRAYDLYLRARNVRAPFEQRIALLEQAIRVDSTLAAAHALLARLLVNQNVASDTARIHDVIARAKQEAAQAIALDSTSVEAHTALAVLRFRYDWQWAEAERLHLRAIALNPSDPDAHLAYARTLRSFGRFDECHREYLTSEALDPLGAGSAMSRGRAFYFARDYERALRFYLSLLSRDSTNSRLFLFETYLMLRRFDKAEQELRRRAPPTVLPTHYAALWAAAGREADARALLRPLETTMAPVQSYEATLAYAALGDRDGAMRWLRRAYEERDDRMVDLKVEPRLDPLRSDPRFQELMGRMHFPP